MQLQLTIALCLHIAAAAYWAGSTFVLARLGIEAGGPLVRAQLAAAIVTIASGGFLWHALHEGGLGKTETTLGVGAVAAMLALVLQASLVWPVMGAARRGTAVNASAHVRARLANRAAALLLLVATLSMAGARFL